MNDLIRFIALAVVLGVAAGMMLGGVALLLAAPAYASERKEHHVRLECMPVLRSLPAQLRLEI